MEIEPITLLKHKSLTEAEFDALAGSQIMLTMLRHRLSFVVAASVAQEIDRVLQKSARDIYFLRIGVSSYGLSRCAVYFASSDDRDQFISKFSDDPIDRSSLLDIPYC